MYVHFVRTNQIRPFKVVLGSWWVLLATCPVLPLRMRMHVCGLYGHFVRTNCLCRRTAPKRRSLFAVVCTDMYVHFVRTFSTDTAAAPRGAEVRWGNRLSVSPVPFPAWKPRRKNFKGLSLISYAWLPFLPFPGPLPLGFPGPSAEKFGRFAYTSILPSILSMVAR